MAGNTPTTVDFRRYPGLGEPSSPALGERVPLEGFDVTMRMIRAEDLSDREIAATLDLLRDAFNGGPGWFALPVSEADHLRWKVCEFPYGARAYFVEHGARIVGFGARMDRRWIVRGDRRLGRDGVEAALHPEFQGSGLYGKRRDLLDRYEDRSDFSLSFGSHPATLHARIARGTRPVANPLDNLVRPLDLGKYARSSRASRSSGSRTRIALEGRRRVPKPVFARQLAWRARLLRQRWRYPPLEHGHRDWTVRTVPQFDARIEPFFERAARPFALIQERTQRWLNWRYTDRRAGPFTIRLAEVGDEIVGYAVLRATARSAELADLLVLPDREDVAHGLIQDALERARVAGSPAMRSWMMEHHPYHRLLLHSGFLPVRRIVIPGFKERSNPRDFGFIDDPHARIHLMLGDTDHI